MKLEDLNVTLKVVKFTYKPLPGPVFRSCWKCNTAHKHLRKTKHLVCIVCGNEYRRGKKVSR